MSTSLTPYLTFDGNTRQAFAFYEKNLAGKIKAMWSYNDMPTTAAGCDDAQMPRGEGIMHACLELPGGAMLMAGDSPPGMTYERISGVMIALQFDTNEQATETFHALAQGGQVSMPLSPTFWAENFGMLTDQFGVSWAVNGKPVEFG